MSFLSPNYFQNLPNSFQCMTTSLSIHHSLQCTWYTAYLILLLYVLCKHPSLKGSGQSILTLKSHPMSRYPPMSWGLSCMVIWLIPCSVYDFLNPLEFFSPPHTCHVETIAFYSSLYPKCPSPLRKCSFTWATAVSCLPLSHHSAVTVYSLSILRNCRLPSFPRADSITPESPWPK